ncbi:MAG: hypothetical protein RR275_08890 [Lachnospiraceae bacterium]
MSNYICSVCGNSIGDGDGNFVKIKDSTGEVLKVVPVHKGECDDRLCAWGRANGYNTNGSMEISFFDSEEQRQEYLNGTFSMTDDEFYDKFFNADGTLKS